MSSGAGWMMLNTMFSIAYVAAKFFVIMVIDFTCSGFRQLDPTNCVDWPLFLLECYSFFLGVEF